mgnify:FL=1|jgi:hypothetical protein
MALPKLNAPTHTLVLPSSGEEVKFRPFLVKEQKLLLMAQQSEDTKQISDSMVSVISNCTGLDATNLPTFDVEYIFLKIRGKSVGDIVELNLICPDDGVTQVFTKIDLNEVEVQISEDHKSEIQITDQIKLVMTYPTLSIASEQGFSTESIDSVFNLLQTCIKEIHSGDEVFHKIDMKTEEITEFVESLNTEQFNSVIAYFDTMPKLRHVVEVTNPKTGVTSEILLEGMESFLE